MLDAFVAERLRFDAPAMPAGLEPEGRSELVVHRNAKSVYDYRYQGHRIIAKVYDDTNDGDLAWRVLKALWTNGFGPGSIHRVPEPLLYLPEHRTLLIEPAGGECLLPRVFRDADACRAGMKHAAAWLAALHMSPVREGSPDNSARILYRLARKLVRAASYSSELEQTLTLLGTELGRRGVRVTRVECRVPDARAVSLRARLRLL